MYMNQHFNEALSQGAHPSLVAPGSFSDNQDCDTDVLDGRWANVLSDYSRQTVVECFLGLRLNEHFPSLTLPYQGERSLPLGEVEDDEADLENSPPSTLKDKVLPSSLISGGNCVPANLGIGLG